ncbi:MAG: hypothetical protein M3M95_05000 [Pseudomonadota bacterium]|nr:hypothetical protein [Pseudomonadota bacterium]
MRRRLQWLLAVAALGLPAPSSAAEPRPLFADDGVLQLEIRGPIAQVSRAEEPAPATLTLKGAVPETHAIRLSPRGITRRRRETCSFPPLRVEFSAKPAATSLFRGQKRLKLVTHCRAPVRFQQYILLEYAAYRLFNLVTPSSFRVRLAQIDYVGLDGELQTSRAGFFIEDIDDAARRNGAKEARVGDRVPASQLSPADAASFAVFQYMIGNLDWSMNRGPEGRGCCHNSRLISPTGTAGPYVPVPDDFDFSGLVDAPYAVPPDSIDLPNVRVRLYRGYCGHNSKALAAIGAFRSKRAEFHSTLAGVSGLDGASRRKAAAYLDGFFEEVASEERVSRLLKPCIR